MYRNVPLTAIIAAVRYLILSNWRNILSGVFSYGAVRR